MADPKKIRTVSKDVTRDDVTDERKGYKTVTRKRPHGGTVTKKKTYKGDVTETEKVKTDRSGKVKKVVLKTRKQVDAYKNKKGTASRLSQDNNAKRTGAIKPKERTSRRVLKGDAAKEYVAKKKLANAAVSERVRKKAKEYIKGETNLIGGENAQERVQGKMKKTITNLRGEPIRPKNPYK